MDYLHGQQSMCACVCVRVCIQCMEEAGVATAAMMCI